MPSRFTVGIGSGSTADVCHCAASSAPDGHIHRYGEVLCLHRVNECAAHCPARPDPLGRRMLMIECGCGVEWTDGHVCES